MRSAEIPGTEIGPRPGGRRGAIDESQRARSHAIRSRLRFRVEAGSKIRVMLVDDSASFRNLLAAILGRESDIEVVGAASSGLSALMKLPDLQPDCIVLDIQMPGMDGLKTLREVKRLYPAMGVLICSAASKEGVDLTVEALSSGALDFVTKAPRMATGESLLERLRNEIVPTLRAFKRYGRAVPSSPVGERTEKDDVRLAVAGSRDIIAVGVSTGGPSALRTILPEIPAEVQATFLVVQHMPPIFTYQLAEQLNSASKVRVKEAEEGEQACHGTVYIAPGDFHLEIRRCDENVMIQLTQSPQENSVRPAADVLFRSIASSGLAARSAGIVMTGMGQDGFAGAQVLKERGGVIIAQDQASSLVWGMPRFVVEAGIADKVCSLSDIPRVIARLTARAQPASDKKAPRN